MQRYNLANRNFYFQILPKDWQTIPASISTKDFVIELLKKGIPVFKILSEEIKEDHGYFINSSIKYFFDG